MAGSSKYFDAEDFNRWKKRQGSSYKMPPRANFVAAANHMRNFFESKKLNWAVMLGLAMACLGSRREMMDIHILYDDRDLNRIKMKLEADQRVRLPNGMNSLFPAKILVATGPRFKDVSCTQDVEVEVDLVPPGAYGTPPNDILTNNQVLLRLKNDANLETFKGLNMLYLVKTTIAYCKNQDLAWDPKKDLLFMCQFYGREIELIRNQLNARQIQEDFLGTPFVLRLPLDEQRRCYHVLLGADKDPPPSMSLTPAPPIGHRFTASASDINTTRPRIISHKSSPSLNTMQQSSNFLAPPLPGRPKKAESSPQSAPPTTTSIPVPQTAAVAPERSSQRDSRSRYRHSSVPNTPNGIRSLSPETKQHNASRTRSAERLTHPPEEFMGQAKVVVMQKIQQHPDPVIKSSQALAQGPSLPISMRPQKSMPTLAGRTVGPVPVFAHGQNAVSPQNPKTSAPLAVPQVGSVPNNTPQGLQGRAQSQERSLPQNQNVPRSSDARGMGHTTAQPHLPRPHDISQSRPTADSIGSTSDRNTSTSSSVQPSTSVSDVHEQRYISASTLKLSQQSQPQPQSQSQQPTVKPFPQNPRTPSSVFVYELEAGPQAPVTAHPSKIPSNFIAELPGDTRGHLSGEGVGSLPKATVRVEPERTHMAPTCMAQTSDMARMPPHDHTRPLGQFPPSPPQISKSATSLPSNTPPSTSVMLPSSLMIGHRQIPPVKSASQPLPHLEDAPVNVNAQKYSAPIYSSYTDLPPSVKKATTSQYKAYSSHMSPPGQSSEFMNRYQRPAYQTKDQMLQTQHPEVPEASVSHAQHVRQPQPQPGSYVHHPIRPAGNPPTPPASEFEVSNNFPQPEYGMNTGGVIGARTLTSAEYSRDAQYGNRSADAAGQNRGNPAHFIAFQPGGAYTPNHYSPPVALSVITSKESTSVQIPRPVVEPGHKRSTSRDSQASTSSHDSAKLAQEYQAHLPDPRSRFADDVVDFT